MEWKRGKIMSLQKIIAEGFLTLPNSLLLNFKTLNLTPSSFTVWLYLYQMQKNGATVLDIEVIAQKTAMSSDEIYEAINYLVNQQLIQIKTEEDEMQKLQTIVDLSATFEKLDFVSNKPQMKLNDLARLSQIFEQELGRTLSPIEFEEIQKWVKVDKYSPELIELALKEAVLNQKKNFKYVLAILKNWSTQGYQTAKEIENAKVSVNKGKVLNIHIPMD